MRKKRQYKRIHKPDVVHGNIAVTRFINYLMEGGKKTTAEKVMYDALDAIAKSTKLDGLEVFLKAMENVAPQVETMSRRVGGANYQIPEEVRPERKFVLAARWIIGAARAKKGKPMADKLAEELAAAYKNDGAAIKKKLDVHRMAEANRAFAHFARKRTA
ncbi:MAG: 30S ribosomal protein S7 [Candidatus Colwellbacteria bacterium RIFCSPLOWO2_01_FULL_48_10]|uniref:Small ribosomal subunit protein uS7 n=1 Tax=Candidatus Colwellbacteria bacterium RIFCSPLOWO2_01_FULL_48_10 TaxID=1797690 RepID=A0A1G1Z542_9BACT|nr:MAG: 30S ribosomal protein S7 [Candidatus Colwellbacteria bacterium RIFCSPLOWO2_01_FULL_48_10]